MVITVLVLSDKNETRSQILEGWLRYYTKDSAKIVSAGLETGKLNMIAAKAMMEAVIDITKQVSNPVQKFEKQSFDHVIALTKKAKKYAKKQFPGAKLHFHPVEHPLNPRDRDLEKLEKHRKLTIELEDFAMQFVHENIIKLI